MSATKDLTPLVFDDKNQQKPDPFAVFSQWLAEAKQSEVNDANAMSLATIDETLMPDCRIMLLNGLDDRGFVFYTNSRSAKGKELTFNAKACLLFHWKSVRRQVRIRGEIIEVSAAQADEYFATRPRGSQIGAHASEQSGPVSDKDHLGKNVEKFDLQFKGIDVPRPDHWRGFRLEPIQIEFWQDGEFRLHDRIVYARTNPNQPWTTNRLYP